MLQGQILRNRLSSTKISSIVQDQDGFVWFGTQSGLNKYAGTVYLIYTASGYTGTLSDDNIFDLCISGDGCLWAGTHSGLVKIKDGIVYNPVDFYHDPVYRVLELDGQSMIVTTREGILMVDKDSFQGLRLLRGNQMNRIQQICVSPSGDIWFVKSSEEGDLLQVVDKDFHIKKTFPLLKNNRIIGLLPSRDHRIWAATENGLLCFDDRDFSDVPAPPAVKDFLQNRPLLFLRNYGNNALLLGVRDAGLFRLDLFSGQLSQVHEDHHLPADTYACTVDSGNNIWLADGSTYPEFLPSFHAIRRFPVGENQPLKRIVLDEEGYLWFCSDNAYGCFDRSTNTVCWLREESLSITDFTLDPRGYLWAVAGHNKLMLFRRNKGTASLIRTYELEDDINGICMDKDRDLWICHPFKVSVGTPGEQLSFQEIDPDVFNNYSPTILQTDNGSRNVYLVTTNHYVYECRFQNLILSNFRDLTALSAIFTASDGSLWVGTTGNGLYHIYPSESRMESYGLKEGLLEMDVRAIQEDHNGNIWFSTPTKISMVDVRDHRIVALQDANLTEGHYYEALCSAIAPDGTLYFGGDNGLTSFHPESQLESGQDRPIPVQVLRVTIDGTMVPLNGDPVILHPDNRQISLVYSGISFSPGVSFSYAIQLEGYDKDWNYTTEQNVSYNNLKPGQYTFRAKVRMQNGEWSREELTLPVVVEAGLLNSRLAHILYYLLGLTLILVIIYFSRRWYLQRKALEQLRYHEQLRQEQIDFITNISHEFRTPLSLVYAPLKQLSEDDGLAGKDRLLVSTAMKNAERLKNLADQILDPSIDKSVNESLRVSNGDISGLVKNISENFLYAAHQKNILFQTDLQEDIYGFADAEKVKKMVFNLLSNAFKYTPEGGSVLLTLRKDEDRALLEVRDNGIGIPENRREHLFGRFDRLGREAERGAGGSGIGLNYAQTLARLHKGNITYRPNTPKGSVFAISIPLSKDSYIPSEIQDAGTVSPEVLADKPAEDKLVHNKTVVIAEDNQEVRTYLKSLLGTQYNVIACNNGEEAWENIATLGPDLVISDVVMPVMDGYKLCHTIKKSEDFSHLPIILLTAKKDIESNIRGLETGADAYIAKPFDPHHLMAVVKNLLVNRALLQQKIGNLTKSSAGQEKTVQEMGLNSAERKFLERLQKAVENHLNEESFKVDTLATELKMSHSGLYTKVKSLTGHSPQTYVNNYRMNVAMEMLKTGDFTVAEVADSIGASSISNFSRDFKRHFGVSPSAV